jgi:predicted metalloprotease with PDZ domain
VPIRYHLSIPEPHTHLVHVRLEIDAAAPGPLRLVMPSWTPGSYLLREFPRNVQAFRAEAADAAPLAWAKSDKNTWQIELPAAGGRVIADYTVYANELTVRTSHVDASHAFLNGASVFMYVEGREQEPIELEIEAPADWHATTALPRAEGAWRFRAASFDALVDSPIEIGTHAVYDFEAEGRPHCYAVWGRGAIKPERLIADTRAIIAACSALFGDLPYDDYTFLLHLLGSGRGGLEHRSSCALHLERTSFRTPDAPGGGLSREYESALALIAHEFFHVWNATRIRPEALERYDDTRENYTRALWVAEGLTTYYTDLTLRRAGLITPERYLERLGEAITRLQQLAGRHVQTLEESSFDAWIKFYRPDAHTPNAEISYYQKGALVGLLLDLHLRARTGNRRSLDDLMRALWKRYGQPDQGFPESGDGSPEAIASELCGDDLSGLFDSWLRSTDELDFDRFLAAAGLRLVERPAPASDAAALEAIGMRLRPGTGNAVVAYVLAGTPAYVAGLNAGDEILAIGGVRTDAARLASHLAAIRAQAPVMLTIARRDELLALELDAMGAAPAAVLRIERVGAPTPEQDAIYAAWLGIPDNAAAGSGAA